MHSTPKIKASATRGWVTGLVLLGTALLLGALAVRYFPQPPQAPRYMGHGHETPRSGGLLTFAESSNVRTLDPHYAYDTLSTAAIRLLFDGLLDYNQQGQMIASLAQELPVIDKEGHRFRFTLRKGIRFHNGREMVANDIAWSMHRLLSKDIGSPGYPFYKSIIGAQAFHKGKANHIEGIVVHDKYTISFTLDEPDQTFLNAMAMTFAYPLAKEEVERLEKSQGRNAVGRHPIGAGPFRLERWERGVELMFTRFKDYWNPQPRVDRIRFLENISNQVATARLRNGDIDIHLGPAKVDSIFFRSAKAWQSYREEFASPSISALVLNCELAPFDNIHVRRAVAHAIDREKIRRLDPSRFIIAGQILPPMLPGYDAELPNLQIYDLQKAKEEMRLAGLADGWPEPVEIWGRGQGDSKIAEVIREDLAKIGITIDVKIVSFATYLKETGKPRVAQAMFSGWHQDFPDPSNFMDILFHTRSIHPTNSENRAFYRNPKLDALLDGARAQVNKEQRLQAYRQANDILAHDAPWVFLFYPMESFVWQPYVKNFKPHPVWLQEYRNIWLDLPRKRTQQEEPTS